MFIQQVSAEEKPIYKVGAVIEKSGPGREILKILFKPAFNRAGGELEFVGCTPSNCTQYLKEGRIDAELSRIKEYGELYPEFIRVNVSLISVEVGVYSFWEQIKFERVEDLNSYSGKIYYQNGLLYPEVIIKNSNLTPFSNLAHGISLLKKDKTGVMIFVSAAVKIYAKAHPELVKDLKEIGKIDSIQTFPYFHKKHEKVAQKLEAVLKNMQEDGSLKEIHAGIEKKYGKIF